MARAIAHEEGFNIVGQNGRSAGWIDILTEDEDLRREHFMRTAMILNEIINNPKHAVQPDWSFLNEVPSVAQTETAPMPTRTIKKVEVPAEAKTV